MRLRTLTPFERATLRPAVSADEFFLRLEKATKPVFKSTFAFSLDAFTSSIDRPRFSFQREYAPLLRRGFLPLGDGCFEDDSEVIQITLSPHPMDFALALFFQLVWLTIISLVFRDLTITTFQNLVPVLAMVLAAPLPYFVLVIANRIYYPSYLRFIARLAGLPPDAARTAFNFA